MPFVNQASVRATKRAPQQPPPYYPPGLPWPPLIDIPMSAQFNQTQIDALNQLSEGQLDEIGLPPHVSLALVVTSNQIQVTISDPGGSNIMAGIKYSSAGLMYVTNAAVDSAARYQAPFRFSDTGAMYITTNTPVYYQGGLPFDRNGALCYSSLAGTGYVQGWPLNSSGVCMNGVATVPGTPAAPTAVAGDTNATVTWTPPSNGGSAITGYKVRATPGGAEQSAAASPHIFTGLTNGTPYGFEVAAINAVGQGPWSPVSSSVTPNPQPIFWAPLLTTVVPTVATGSGTATFTRAATAYVADFEGVLKRAISGEARFWGARRVHNVVMKSQNFSSTSDWPVDFGSVTRTSNYGTAPDGTTTSTRMQFSGANGSWVQMGTPIMYLSGKTPDNIAYRGSVYVKGTAGQTFNIWTRTHATGSNQSAKQVTLTGGWDRITPDGSTLNNVLSSDVPTICFGTRNLDLTLGTAVDVEVWGAQLEGISGQTIQIPSEYVSSGVLSSPYHGACVDGVKYFAVANGNSVSSNRITEATGAAFSDSLLRGYLPENTHTNTCIRSQEFDNASWTKTNCTITANQTAAPDGSLTADLFTDDATNASHQVNITASQLNTCCFSVYVKLGASNPLTWMQLVYINAAPSTAYANFNLSTGAKGSTNATYSLIEPLGNGWYRVSITWGGFNGTGTFRICGLSADTASAAPSYVGTSKTMYIWGAQVEEYPSPSSYIPTTTSSANRAVDLLSYASSGNFNSTVGSAYGEFAAYGNIGDNKNHTIIGNPTNYHLNAASWRATMNNTSGGSLSVGNNADFAGGRNKCMCRWGHTGATRAIIQNGGAIVSGAFTGSYASATFTAGMWSTDSAGMIGGVRNIKFYSTSLSDAQMTSLTT